MVAVSYGQDSASGSCIAVETDAANRLRIRLFKQARLVELRTAIQHGEYHVSAADLADALLRSASFAN